MGPATNAVWCKIRGTCLYIPSEGTFVKFGESPTYDHMWRSLSDFMEDLHKKY